jgi:hypothetical protein
VWAATLLLAPLGVCAEKAAQAAATLYAIKYKGCHSPPEVIHCQVPFLLGQFANIESGSMIFILVPDNSGKLLVLLCHKRRFGLCRPQQGHCPRRSIN